MGKNDFWQKVADDSAYTLGVKTFVKITLPCTFSREKQFLRFMQKFNMATQNGGKIIFGKKWQIILLIPWGLKLSSKSLYLAPFPEKNNFCGLCRNSTWPPKMAEKLFLAKSERRLHVAKKIIQITLSCTVSKINVFFSNYADFKMAAKNGGKTILEKGGR